MAKVITFSRTFPKGHPRAGEPTYFVESFYKSLYLMKVVPGELENFNYDKFLNGFTKNHTIRAGHRFKKGDFFSPRVWGTDINPKSGKSGPYQSKQIIIAPDTEILEVWDITINEWTSVCVDGKFLSVHQDIQLAHNDGLSVESFFNWFSKMPFEGQIICWKENIKY